MQRKLTRDRTTIPDPAGPRGLTLIELLIAILILSIGSVAALRTMGQAREVVGGELPRLMAQTAALNRAEAIQMLGLPAARGLPSSVTMGPETIRLTLDTAPTESGFVEVAISAKSSSGPGAHVVVYTLDGGE